MALCHSILQSFASIYGCKHLKNLVKPIMESSVIGWTQQRRQKMEGIWQAIYEGYWQNYDGTYLPRYVVNVVSRW